MSIGMFEGDLVVANDLLMPQSSVGIAGFSHQGFRTNFEMPDGMSIAAEETGDGHSRKRGDLAPNLYPVLSSLRRMIMPCWAGCAKAMGA